MYLDLVLEFHHQRVSFYLLYVSVAWSLLLDDRRFDTCGLEVNYPVATLRIQEHGIYVAHNTFEIDLDLMVLHWKITALMLGRHVMFLTADSTFPVCKETSGRPQEVLNNLMDACTYSDVEHATHIHHVDDASRSVFHKEVQRAER